MAQAEARRELTAKIPAPSQQLIQKCAIRATIRRFEQFYAHADVCIGPTTAMPNKNESTWNKLVLVIVREHYFQFLTLHIGETVSYSVSAAFRLRCQKTNLNAYFRVGQLMMNVGSRIYFAIGSVLLAAFATSGTLLVLWHDPFAAIEKSADKTRKPG